MLYDRKMKLENLDESSLSLPLHNGKFNNTVMPTNGKQYKRKVHLSACAKFRNVVKPPGRKLGNVVGARHFVERHFVYYDTSSKVFVELPVRRKVTSSNAFSSNSTLSRTFA